MIAKLLLAVAAIVAEVATAKIAFRRGKALGMDARLNTALPRELVPTRQLRRSAGREIARRIALAAAKPQ